MSTVRDTVRLHCFLLFFAPFMYVKKHIIVSKWKFRNSVRPIPHVKLIHFLFAVLRRVIVIIPLVWFDKQQASRRSNVSDHATRLKHSGLWAVFVYKKDELVKVVKDESVLYIFLSPELASSHLLDILGYSSLSWRFLSGHFSFDWCSCISTTAAVEDAV